MKNKSFLNKIIYSYYDSFQDKIITDFPKDSLVWLHEYKHKLQFQNKHLKKFDKIYTLLRMNNVTEALVILILLVDTGWRSLIILFYVFYFMLMFYLELEAWFYAIFIKLGLRKK